MAASDRVATEKIYKQHYPTITKWIKSSGGSEADANDIYQEAMIVLYEKSQNADFRLKCRIGTYLFAISKHLWYKKIQEIKKSPAQFEENDEKGEWRYEDDILAHAERENHYRQLDNALEQLGEPCQSILKAYYHKNMSMQEIAAGFGYTNPDNAKTQKYKCLTRLKKLFYSVKDKITE
jgi:RNA polymerase sigma factor (sigma-70 family)